MDSVSRKIQVFCRVRPKLKREKTYLMIHRLSIHMKPTIHSLRYEQTIVVEETNSNTSRYVLDHVFPPNPNKKIRRIKPI